TLAGATRFDGNVWSTLTTRDGLIGNQVGTICEDKEGAIWLGTERGITRYQRPLGSASRPTVAVEIDKNFEKISELPAILRGRRVTFHVEVGDHKTRAENRRFRYRFDSGSPAAAQSKQIKDWSAPQKETQFEWSTNRVGNYLLAVQYIDRDLNYSEP